MKQKAGLTLALTLTCFILNTVPALAGEWKKTENEQWQYIQDDGTTAIGWLKLDGKKYYMDEKGNRKSDYWLRDDGAWYYLDRNGEMVTNAWVDNYYVDEHGRYEKKR